MGDEPDSPLGNTWDSYASEDSQAMSLVNKVKIMEKAQTSEVQKCTAARLMRKAEFTKITEEDMEELFACFDMDGNNLLSIHEIQTILKQVIADEKEQKRIQSAIMASDADGNGHISLPEFRQALRLGSDNDLNNLLCVIRGSRDNETSGCSGEVLLTYLRTRRQNARNCMALPGRIFFFAIVWLLAIVHLENFYAHRQSRVVQNAFLSRLTSVNTFDWALQDDFFDWMDTAVLPTVFGASPPGRMTSTNQVVGGVLISRKVVEASNCIHPNMNAIFASEEEESNAPGELCSPSVSKNLTYWLPLSLPLEECRKRVLSLRSDGWLASATPAIDVSLLIYNGVSGFFTFAHFAFQVEIGGHWLLMEDIESFNSYPYHSESDWYFFSLLALDACFGFMIVYMLMKELGVLCHACKVPGGLRQYARFWKGVDWCVVFLAAVIGVHWLFDVKFIMEVRSAALELVEHGNGDPVDLHSNAGRMSYLFGNLRWLVAVFSGLSMFQFFGTFRGNPRLDLVTQTIIAAAKDLAHFGIVFLCIFFTFVLMGHCLFGARVDKFARLRTSVDTCFVMLQGIALTTLREEMVKGAGRSGLLWVWSFVIIMQLLLMSMILAIILDVYSGVRGSVIDAPTLYAQACEVFNEWKQDSDRLKRYKARLQQAAAAGRRSLELMSPSFKGRGSKDESSDVEARREAWQDGANQDVIHNFQRRSLSRSSKKIEPRWQAA